MQIEAEREREIGIEVALMRLIEQHAGDAFEAGITLQAPHQQALSDDFDTHPRGTKAVQPGGQADRLAERLPKQLRHPPGSGARGDPAWLQDQQLAARGPGLVPQYQWHKRRFARTWRRDQHGIRLRGKRGGERRQRLGHRQIHGQQLHRAEIAEPGAPGAPIVRLPAPSGRIFRRS